MNHVATVCAVEGHVVVTAAFLVVESTAMSALLREVDKRVPERGGCGRRLLSRLVEVTCAGCRRETSLLRKLRTTPTLETLFTLGLGLKVPVAPCVVQLRAASEVVEAYEGGGTKFRDRTSRHEAARHFGDAIESLLLCPV